jgi:hypothetical protein
MNGKLRANAVAALAAVAYMTTAGTAQLHAQNAKGSNPAATHMHVDTVAVVRSSATLRIAKWTSLAASAGLAAYGFKENREADRNFATLEQMCVDNRAVCERRNGPAYSDPDLESRYQKVRTLDHRSRNALLASQVGIAGTVLLFIFDLRHNRPARDIPYKPDTSALEVLPGRDGGLQLSFTLPLSVDKR